MPATKTVTVKEAVPRANADGYYVTEYALRHWIRIGAIPVRKVGQKQLLYYPNLIRFLQCVDGADNAPVANETAPGIRRVER